MVEEPVDLIMIGGDPVAAIPAAGGADQYAALAKQVYLEPELAVINVKARAVQLRQQAWTFDDVLPANVKRQHPQESTFQTGGEAVTAPSSAIRENGQVPAIVINRQNLSWYCQA